MALLEAVELLAGIDTREYRFQAPGPARETLSRHVQRLAVCSPLFGSANFTTKPRLTPTESLRVRVTPTTAGGRRGAG